VIKVTINSKIDRINRVLNMLPQEMQFAAYDKALPAAGRVVAHRAKENAPRSSKTGTRDKMSSKAKATWSPEPVADMLEVKPVKGRKIGVDPYVLVGPKFPEGNKANFVHPMKQNVRKVKLWGSDPTAQSGVVSPARKDNDFLKRAADETIPQQLTAFLKALIPDVRQRLKRLGNVK
jgi:hypothetical protein